MRKGIVVALACLAAGFSGLFASPAKGLQFGFNVGYTSVGFQLHGMGGEFLFGFQGQDEHRPKGSVLRIGLAGAAGTSPGANLTKATWNGESYDDFRSGIQNAAAGAAQDIAEGVARDIAEERVADGGLQAARDGTIQALAGAGISEPLQAQVDGAIAAGAYALGAGAQPGAPAFTSLPPEAQQEIINEVFQGIRDEAIASEEGQAAIAGAIASEEGQAAIAEARATARAAAIAALEQGLQAGYGIDDLSKAKGDATAFFVSAAYEYVLGSGMPGLGFIVGGELYVSQGGYASLIPSLPSVSTEGGIGGGGVLGISYYLKNGFNLTVKTGLGVIDPGEVKYDFGGGIPSLTVEPEKVFYASPTFALGYIY